MLRLQTIENNLKAINPTVFQELCDSILIRLKPDYKGILRQGSVSGKQKTKKGTPDTLILLPSGKYLMVEYSTNISEGYKKLEEDILKNLDEGKTGIKTENIAEIVICANFSLKNEELDKLKEITSNYNIILDFWGLDRISIEINSHHNDLANQYLDLPLDTGQIVPIERFIEEYNNASQGIAAPLNNKFLYRENELNQIENLLDNFDFIILTGAPGVGKTKFGIEAINRFVKRNTSYNSFAISYKHHHLLDDLNLYLSLDKDYILLVDDANRIDALQQIISFYNYNRRGKLKIILTVRDYAQNLLINQLASYKYETIILEKLTDEQITEIIKEEPFEILNPRYQSEILRIADGNPRIAVMASILAKEKQDLAALNDVSDLFERYFSTFILDHKDFDDKQYLKVLGLIAFFYALPYKNRELISNILNDFGIDYIEFNNIIEKLERLELVEVRYDYVKIPEQNLSTFFFYKAFIQENLLSIKILLEKYYEKNKDRFRDTIIPANNTFGAEKVMNKLKPALKDYYNTIKDDYDKASDFLLQFWFYLIDETLLFIYEQISQLAESENSKYDTAYEINQFAYEKNNLIELLGNLFLIPKKTKQILQLSIELIRKAPNLLPEFIHKINEVLLFDIEDERYNFIRQVDLFDELINGIENNDELSAIIFFELAKTFIKNKFQHTKGGRNYSIQIYQYAIPNNEIIKKFRKKIWNTTNKYFSKYPKYAFNFLKPFAEMYPDVNKDIMSYDIPFVLEIINSNLDKNNFEHCKYVHDQIWWFERHNFNYPEFDALKREFTNETYKKFMILNWDKLKEKNYYEFEDYNEYNRLKEQEIRDNFIFENLNDFKSFIEELNIMLPHFKHTGSNVSQILNIIVDENCKRDFDLGCELLIELTKQKIHFIPYLIFQNHLISPENIKKVWQIIQKNAFENKFNWELFFFENIKAENVSKEWSDVLLHTLRNANKNYMIFFYRFEKFLDVDPDFFQKILKLSLEINNKSDFSIEFWTSEVFVKYFDKVGEDIDLIANNYKQQFLLQPHFDIDNKGLINILKLKPSFIVDLIEELYKHSGNISLSGRHLDFSNIWVVDKIEASIEKAINIIIDMGLLLSSQRDLAHSFFKNENIGYDLKQKSNNFIEQYIEKYYRDPQKIEVILDIIKRNRKEIFEDMLILYLKLNPSLDSFKKINLVSFDVIYGRDIIIGDIIANKWKEVLHIIENANLGTKMIPIREFIKDNIERALEEADKERQQRFIGKP